MPTFPKEYKKMGVNPVNCLSPLEIAISPKNHPQKSRFLETKLKLRKILSIKPYIKMWYSENSDKIAIIKWSQNFKIFQIEQNLLLSQKGIFWNFQRPISPCPWRPQTCQVFFWSQHQKYYHPYKYQPKFLIHNARTLCNVHSPFDDPLGHDKSDVIGRTTLRSFIPRDENAQIAR